MGKVNSWLNRQQSVLKNKRKTNQKKNNKKRCKCGLSINVQVILGWKFDDFDTFVFSIIHLFVTLCTLLNRFCLSCRIFELLDSITFSSISGEKKNILHYNREIYSDQLNFWAEERRRIRWDFWIFLGIPRWEANGCKLGCFNNWSDF